MEKKTTFVVISILAVLLLIIIVVFLIFKKSLVLPNFSNKPNSASTSALPTPPQDQFPTYYKEEAIPPSVYLQSEDKYKIQGKLKADENAIFFVMRFYIYKDVLTENNIVFTQPSSEVTIDYLESEV